MAVVLAFYKGRKADNPHARLFDQAVCAWPRTAGAFSHVELVASTGICWSSSIRDGGVRGKKIDLDTGRWVKAIYAPGDDSRARRWFARHDGMPYDALGLAGFVLPWRTDQRKAVFCSEAVARALGIARAWALCPNDLFRLCVPMPTSR